MRSSSFSLVALLAAALAPLPVWGADRSELPDRRDLAGHHFLVSHLVEDPFSVTSFGMNFGLGGGEALGPALDRTTSPPTTVAGSKWYGFVSLGEEFDLTVRLLEYLSLHGALTTGVRQGAGDGSALVVGTNVLVNGLLGVKGSLPLTEGLRASLSGEFSYGPQLSVLLLKGLREGMASGTIDTSDVFNDRNAQTTTLTGAIAWAPTPWLGLTGNLRYLRTQASNLEGTEEDGVSGAASAEVDALPLLGWLPLGASVAYRRTGSLGSGGLALQDEWGGGLFYTGRRNLALGLEVDRRQGRLETELKSKQTLAWVNFRYFW